MSITFGIHVPSVLRGCLEFFDFGVLLSLPFMKYFTSGENGEGIQVDVSDLSVEDRRRYDTGKNNHHFNEYASDLISVHRSLPDIRYARLIFCDVTSD